MSQFEITSGQSILKEEVEKTIQSMKRGKATGSDEISTEMLRALDDRNIDVIPNLCNITYNNWVNWLEAINIHNSTKEVKSTELYRI